MPSKRTHRSPEERIAELQSQIRRLQTKSAERKVRRDPALRHIAAAVRSIDKGAAETQDKTTREALAEARSTLAACLALNGAVPAAGGGVKPSKAARAAGPAPDPERVLAHLRDHPGSRSPEICEALGTDTATLRRVLHELRDAGKIRVEGKARATRYTAR